MDRRAKIVATLGPASASPDSVLALVRAGMDVARLNLSHGTHEDHRAAYLAVRAAGDTTGHGVAVLADLQGPKIRLGTFTGGRATLPTGGRFTITTEPVDGDAQQASTTYTGLPDDVAPGHRILVDDGRVVLEVADVDPPEVHTRVVVGGPVSDHKGLNLPGSEIAAPALTAKDVDDLRFALRLRCDLVALSFVRDPHDVEPVLAVMAEEGYRVPVLAKIEKPEAVERMEEIVGSFDGVMVARGDLGVEIPLEDVPFVQKRAVQLCREHARPVIVATQMLESMVTDFWPTRAEVSDVANALLDGADAVMLSAETSIGRYPVQTVSVMARVLAAAEAQGLDRIPVLRNPPATTGDAVSHAAVDVARSVGARYLVAFTQTGDTARRLARLRGEIPLLAFTPEPAVRSRLSLSWGVEAFLVPAVTSTDAMVAQVDAALLGLGRCAPGEPVVVVAGTPPSTPGSTNTLRVHRIGQAAPFG